jgi:predicted DNA-binding protein
MKVTDLSKAWQEGRQTEERPREYRLRMPLEDAARLSALAALYPDRKESDILNDIANAAVEDLAEMQGLKDVAEADSKPEDQH